MAVYINPLSPQEFNPQYDVLLSSSGGATGLNLLDQALTDAGQFIGRAYSPGTFSSSVVTSTPDLIAGFHVLTWTLGAPDLSQDRLFIDGAEVTSYKHQGASAGLQTSGNFYLGSSNAGPWTQGGFVGTFYRAQFFTQVLSSGQIEQLSNALRTDVANRGAAIAPTPLPQNLPQLYCLGDSLTSGEYGITPYCSLLQNLVPSLNVNNWGISGIQLAAMTGSEAYRIAPRCRSAGGITTAIVFAGTNDFYYGSTAASITGFLTREIQTLSQAGCRVLVGTMLSRGKTEPYHPITFEQDKTTYDAFIRTQAVANGAAGVVFFAADPRLGADGAYANTTYFVDQIHPTQAGHNILADIASRTLAYYYGHTPQTPQIVTSLNYTMQPGDGYLLLKNLTASGTVTLPDCTGPTGATYIIDNQAGSVPVTVVPASLSQPINSSATTTTVSPSATLSLTVVVSDPSTSGCSWSTIQK